MSLVLDSSVTLAWLYDDERSEAVERVFAALAETVGWVPAIWRLEVANALQQGVRRRRIDRDFRTQALEDLTNYEITTDTDTDTFAWTETLALADRFGLTPYDACYLELAQRRGLPLATLDGDLRAAGLALGLELLGA